MRVPIGLILWALTAVAFAVSASPAAADDVDTCSSDKTEPRARLAACERLITSGNYRGRALAPAYGHRGTAYFALDEYDRAIAEYSESIRLDPSIKFVFASRGNVYVEKKDYDRAIADFDQAIRLDAKYADGYGSRAATLVTKRDFDRAIADYDQAIRLEPTKAAHYEGRGVALTFKSNWDRAKADFDQAIRLDPKFANAYVQRARIFLGKRDYDRAIADYDQVIRMNSTPNLAVAYAERGESYEAKGDIDKARADYLKALSIDPNLREPKDGLVRITQRGSAPAAASTTPSPSPGGAPTVKQLFDKHGLAGIWAPDCGTPASARNMYLVVRQVDEGRAQLDRMESATVRTSAHSVTGASEPLPNEISIQVTGDRGAAVMTLRVQAGQLQAFENWHRKCS